jgi:hypothetical protein
LIVLQMNIKLKKNDFSFSNVSFKTEKILKILLRLELENRFKKIIKI